MRSIYPQSKKTPPKKTKHARLSKLRQSAQRRLVVLPLFAIWHLADHRGGGGGRRNLQVAQLSTYHAWPSSYDVKTQRAALTKKDNGHAFSLAFLQTDRRDTREQRDGRKLFNIYNNSILILINLFILLNSKSETFKTQGLYCTHILIASV